MVVYLKSGSTMLVYQHQVYSETTEIDLYSGARVVVENRDIDHIQSEDSSDAVSNDLQVDLEKLLPDTSDPLNWWLDARPQAGLVSKRIFMDLKAQVENGDPLPLARSLEEIKLARKLRLEKIEFNAAAHGAGNEGSQILYLGMDLQYHDSPGLKYEEAFKKLRQLEQTQDLRKVLEFIDEVRASARDRRKEEIISAAILLRDRLDPNYSAQFIQQEGTRAKHERERQGIRSLRE
jgi:hypothetical protein